MIKAAWSIFRIKLASGLQYRLAAFAGATTGLFWVLIEITVITVFYTYADKGAVPAPLSLKQAVTYVWLGQILLMLNSLGFSSEIIEKINSGEIGIELCRPLDLYVHWFAKLAAERVSVFILRGVCIAVVACFLPFGYGLSAPVSIWGLLLMIGSVVSAMFLCTAYAMLVCAIRMKVSLGDGPFHMMMVIGGVLSGAYLPLQLWPEALQDFLLLQPFAGYLDIPVRLYLGAVPSNEIAFVFLLQIFWTVMFVFIGRLIMHRRLKTIVIQGG